MFKELGVQLYTVRDTMTNAEDIRNSFKRLKAMGYDHGQTAGCAIPYDEFGKIAKEENFEISGTHEEFDYLYNNTEEAIEKHKLLDTKYMGIGGISWDYFDSREKFSEFCDKANAICEKIKPHGMKFTYHNHSPEFRKIGNDIVMDLMIKNTDPEAFTFCVDTYWIQYGGGELLYWLEKLGGRIDLLHLKDMKISRWDPEIAEIGNGTFRWPEILKLAEDINVKKIIVEQDGYWMDEDPYKSLKISADYLAQFLDR